MRARHAAYLVLPCLSAFPKRPDILHSCFGHACLFRSGLFLVISDEYETFPDTVNSGDNMDVYVEEDQVQSLLPELVAAQGAATSGSPGLDFLREHDAPEGMPCGRLPRVSAGDTGALDQVVQGGGAVGPAESRGFSSSLYEETRKGKGDDLGEVKGERDGQRDRESTYSSLHREVVKGAAGGEWSLDDEDGEGVDVEAFQVRNNSLL
jgi:hypothetical protein